MNYTYRCEFLFRSEFSVIQSNRWVIDGVNVCSSDCEGLSLMSEAEIALLLFIIKIGYFPHVFWLFL